MVNLTQIRKKYSFNVSPLKVAFFIFIYFLFTPRINFFQLSNGVSDIRLDVLSMFLFWAALIPYLCVKKFKITNAWNIYFIVLWLQFVLILPITSSHLFYAFGQILWYSSMLACLWLGYDTGTQKMSNALKVIIYFSALNSIMHLTGFFFNHSFGLPTVHLLFGFFHLPSPFAFVVGIGLIVMLHTWSKAEISKSLFIILFLIKISTLLLSDSRVAVGAFFIAIIISKINIKWLFVAGLAALASLFIESKALSVFSMDIKNLMEDPSLGIRLSNLEKYLEWVDLEKFFFGGGALSFLEYSIQYGKPAHLDSFFAKILSDHGIFFTIFVILGFIAVGLQSLQRNYRLTGCLALAIFIGGFSLVNEALSSIKSGHFAFFAIGLCFALTHERIIEKVRPSKT